MKKVKYLIIMFVVLFTVVGCGKVATLSGGEDAVATLTDGGISINDLYSALKDKYGAQTVIDLIDNEILNAKYKDSDKEIKEYLNEQIKQIKESAEQNNITYNQLLSYYGFENESAFKDSLTLSFLRDKAVKEYLSENIKDKEIENYYEKEVYGDIKLQHILIKAETDDDATTEEKEKAEKKAKEKAESIIKELDDGAKFTDLAKKYSEDLTNASDGGDLGWVSIGDMVEEFENAAFKLKKGKYTASPVKTVYGYHIIYKSEEKEKPKLETMKDEIISTLVEEKLSSASTLYYDTLEKVRKDAGLKIEDSDLKEAYNTYISNLKKQATSSAQ